MISIVDQSTFDLLIKGKSTFVVFKHSPSCSISARAYSIMSQFDDLPVYIVDVIDDREVSQYVASETSIKHESPQLILFVDGQPIDDVSHHAIDMDLLSLWSKSTS